MKIGLRLCKFVPMQAGASGSTFSGECAPSRSNLAQLAATVNRIKQPDDEVTLCEMSSSVWAEVRPCLMLPLDPSKCTADVLRSVFEGMCKFRDVRIKRGRLDPEDVRNAAYISECGVRLVLLDALNVAPPEAQCFRGLVADWAHKLREQELGACRGFKPMDIDACSSEIQNFFTQWDSREHHETLLQTCAMAILFSKTASVPPAAFISTCERATRLMGARVSLLSLIHYRCPPQEPTADDLALGGAMVGWMESKAASNFSDDRIAGFVEALTADRLSPIAEPLPREPPPATLARCCTPDEATRIADEARPGIRGYGGASQRDRDTLTLQVFDHSAQQRHHVEWLSTYFIDDHKPEAGFERLLRYMKDKMVNPPPMVVRCLGHFIVVERDDRPGVMRRSVKHKTAHDAISHWCAVVKTRRQGFVAVGRSVQTLIHEVELGLTSTDPQSQSSTLKPVPTSTNVQV